MRQFGRSRFTPSDVGVVAAEPFVHRDYRDSIYEIYEEISRQLAVPVRSVMVTGSAFTGLSYREGQPFRPGESDLDVAVVDRDLFRELLLCASRATRYFRDQTSFRPASGYRTGTDTFKNFRSYAFNRGIIRPDLMPMCAAKDQIDDLCQRLTNQYASLFSHVSIAIYGDEEYFVAKVNARGAV